MTVFSERPRRHVARDGSLLPEGWAEVPLKEIVVHALGGEWGADAPAPGLVAVSVLRGKEFREWARDKGSTAATRWVKEASLEKRRLRAGDILVEISGGGPGQPVGRTLLIDDEALRRASHPLICSNFCRQVRLHPAVDPAFAQLALQDRYLRGEVEEFQTQTTNLRNLKFKDYLAGTLLRLPPLAEQRRIGEVTGELLAWLAAAQERLVRLRPVLRRLRQATLGAACSGRLTEDWREQQPDLEPFALTLERRLAERKADREADPGRGQWGAPEPLDAPEVPDGWALVPLRDVIDSHRYGTSARPEKNLKNGVPILRMGNIQDGEIDLSDLKMIDRNNKEVPACELRRGDILFNRTNSPELVGKAAVFDHDLHAIFASYLVRLRCDAGLVSSRYICAWINSPWGRQWARTVRTDCVSQSNINAKKLLAMPFPAPPLAEQHEIVRRIHALFRAADGIEKRFQTAAALVEKLRRTILDRAFRGELVPTEAELARYEGRDYAPAEVFLERMRAESGTASREARPHLEALPPGLTPCPLGMPPATNWIAPGQRSREEVLAAFRQTFWGSREMTREELLHRVTLRLGGSASDKELRTRLEGLLEVALERRIVGRKGDLYVGVTPKLARYDDEFLLETLRTLLPEGDARDRRILTRAVAVWLGYSQVTTAMRDRMEEVFDEGLRRGLLGLRDGRLYFIHSNMS